MITSIRDFMRGKDNNNQPEAPHVKVYECDQLNRLAFAHTYEDADVNIIYSNNSSDINRWKTLSQANKYSTNYTYDANGNIKTLNRYGKDNNTPQKGEKSFDSPEEFLNNDLYNPIINSKTGERYYSEGYLIPMTEDEDKLAIQGAKEELDKNNYNFLGSNCACMVQNALSKAGKEDGSPSWLTRTFTFVASMKLPFIGTAGAIANDKLPRLIYQRIKNQNPGGFIYRPNGAGKAPAKQ